MYLQLLLINIVIVHVVSVTGLLTRCHLGAKSASLQQFHWLVFVSLNLQPRFHWLVLVIITLLLAHFDPGDPELVCLGLGYAPFCTVKLSQH